jgi:hypothetical protein
MELLVVGIQLKSILWLQEYFLKSSILPKNTQFQNMALNFSAINLGHKAYKVFLKVSSDLGNLFLY